MKKIIVIAAVVFVAAVSCVKEQKTVYGPGESIYRSKCGACHPKRDPKSFDRAGWDKVLDKHKDRVPLDPKQRADLLNFLSGEER